MDEAFGGEMVLGILEVVLVLCRERVHVWRLNWF